MLKKFESLKKKKIKNAVLISSLNIILENGCHYFENILFVCVSTLNFF